jgi:hypothetical protein
VPLVPQDKLHSLTPVRLLYGYRKHPDRPGVTVEPREAAVVCAVLAWPAVRGRRGLGNHLVRLLTRDLSHAAVQALVWRIRTHADYYRRGQAHQSLPPDPDLILSGQATPKPYKTAAPSCGSGLSLLQTRQRPGCPTGALS